MWKSSKNYETNNRSSSDFNLAYKFNKVYNCILQNLNVITNKLCLDQVVGESS